MCFWWGDKLILIICFHHELFSPLTAAIIMGFILIMLFSLGSRCPSQEKVMRDSFPFRFHDCLGLCPHLSPSHYSHIFSCFHFYCHYSIHHQGTTKPGGTWGIHFVPGHHDGEWMPGWWVFTPPSHLPQYWLSWQSHLPLSIPLSVPATGVSSGKCYHINMLTLLETLPRT